MTMITTSTERIDSLIALSDKIYPIIDAEFDGQTNAKRILRLGMATVSHALKTGTVRFAGDQLHTFLVGELAHKGLTSDDEAYNSFPHYRNVLRELPRIHIAPKIDPAIDQLAIDYADVLRATISQDESLETDASHAVHLAALALPYAAEYYPYLEQSKVALYCLLHDLVEAYVGDVPSLGVSDDVMDQKYISEQNALKQFKEEFGDNHGAFVQLVLDYENLIDDEARFVKTFDKLDPGFTHFYSAGKQLTDFHNIESAEHFLATVNQTTRRMQKYSIDFLDLMRDRDELTERIADHVKWPN